MGIQGLRLTQGAGGFIADQRPKNWREGVLLLNPNGMAPLVALSSQMKTKVTDDPEFNWWEKGLASRRFTIGGTSLNNTTDTLTTLTLTALDPTGDAAAATVQLRLGDLLYVEESSEILRITAVSGSNFTVQRTWGTKAATAVDGTAAGVNPHVNLIGSAFEEGSSKPRGVNYDPVKKYNYTQIFRNTLEATRTAMNTRLRTGDAMREAKREALLYHTIDMEKALLFGNRIETTLNSAPQRTTGGVIEYIHTDNIINNSDQTVSLSDLEGWMEQLFRYGSSEKMAFVGNRALMAINRAIREETTFNISTGVKEFGMNVGRLISPFGELVLKTHPLFNQITSGKTGTDNYAALDSWMLCLDMSELVYRPLKAADTKFEGNLQTPGDDSFIGGYLTEMGLEVHHGLSHLLVKGVHTGTTDA